MKMEEGDLRGAICLASSNSSIAAPTEDTFHALLDKHPPPPPHCLHSNLCQSGRDRKGFPLGSSAGPDGLDPSI